MTADAFSEFLSEEEVERWANIAADEFSNPQSPWRVQLLEGWEMTDLMAALSPLVQIPGAEGPFDPSAIPPLRAVLQSRDREKIYMLAKEMLSSLPRSSFELIRGLADPRKLRKFLLAQANELKGKPGRPQSLRPSKYSNLVEKADSLYPTIKRRNRILFS